MITADHTSARRVSRPRLGFLGVGWIGRSRMESLVRSETVEVVAVSDPSAECCESAQRVVPGVRVVPSLEALLESDIDGVVIATPSALHAEQASFALGRGKSVFCQKPLARSALEAREVVSVAKRVNRLLSVDLSYRHTEAMRRVRDVVRSNELGKVYAADLTFHNAYGPDKPWFYRRQSSGGGCLMDLGIHLIDLALWVLDFPEVENVSSFLSVSGEPLPPGSEAVEDYASVQLTLRGGVSVRITCSWRLPAGRDAIIEASFFGTRGGAGLRNVEGSFYDFEGLRYDGTSTTVLSRPPDDWGGRALRAWAEALARDPGFNAEAERVVTLHEVIDRIYSCGWRSSDPG